MKLSRAFLIVLLAGGLSSTLVAQDVPPVPAPPVSAPVAPAAPAAVPVARAQAAPRPATPPTPPSAPRGGGATVEVPAPPEPPAPDVDETRIYRDAVRVGSPYALSAGSEASDVVVIMGDATIDGYVHGDLAVVMGDLRLGSTAVVDGETVVVGGSATVAEGATARGEFVVVGGTMTAPPGFLPEGEHVIVGTPYLGSALRSLGTWVTQGLLWGRVIVPGIGWIWWLVALSVFVYVALFLLFPGAIRAIADTLVSRPLSALFAGLLTWLLFPPVVTLMAITVIGAFVIPFVVLAMFFGALLGKAALFSSMGRGVFGAAEPEERLRGLLSLAVGLAVVIVLYMIPIIGVLTWAAVGVLGLGAAALTAFTAMRRERAARGRTVQVPTEPGGGVATAFSAADASSSGGADVPPVVPPTSLGGGAAAVLTGDLAAYPRASFLDRLGAGALDVLLVAVANNLLDFDRRGPFDSFFLMLLLYCIAFWAWKGTTVGGIVVGLRVIRVDGSALRPVDAVVRGLSSLLSFAALGIGFFWILIGSNRERQAWHDMIAGSLVVRVPRNLPLP